MRFIVALSGLAAVVAVPPCTIDDFVQMGELNASAMVDCVGGYRGNIGDCVTNEAVGNISFGCYVHVLGIGYSGKIGDCDIYCINEDDPSIECQNCVAFVAMQAVAQSGPIDVDGACAPDLIALNAANVTEGVLCGGETRNMGAHCLGEAPSVSYLCNGCMNERTDVLVNSCADMCTLNATSTNCLQCIDFGSLSVMAYCTVQDWMPPNCTEDNYLALAAADPPALADCMSGDIGNFSACFQDPAVVNITDHCYAHVRASYDDLIGDCVESCQSDQDPSVICQTCLAFVMMQAVAKSAPEDASGDCAADLVALETANVQAGIVCAGGTRQLGAHCLSESEGVSYQCSKCIGHRNNLLVHSCSALCTDESPSVACRDCINFGSMTVMAYCIESNGVLGTMTMGASLLSLLVALITLVF